MDDPSLLSLDTMFFKVVCTVLALSGGLAIGKLNIGLNVSSYQSYMGTVYFCISLCACSVVQFYYICVIFYYIGREGPAIHIGACIGDFTNNAIDIFMEWKSGVAVPFDGMLCHYI